MVNNNTVCHYLVYEAQPLNESVILLGAIIIVTAQVISILDSPVLLGSFHAQTTQ